MSFTKYTFISGSSSEGEFKCISRSGHWNLISAITLARKLGFAHEFKISHTVFDMSGHGRGGHDGEWRVGADNKPVAMELWNEGERTKMSNGTIIYDDVNLDVLDS